MVGVLGRASLVLVLLSVVGCGADPIPEQSSEASKVERLQRSLQTSWTSRPPEELWMNYAS
jgi:hypothetical protein